MRSEECGVRSEKCGVRSERSGGMRRDVVWTFTIQILIMACSFAINKLLASRLSIDDFGQYNVIKRSVQVLSFLMLAGVGIALPRYIPLYRNGTPPRRILPLLKASLTYILGVSFVVFAVCLLFSSQMQEIVIGTDTGDGLYFVALAYAFILAMAQYVFAYYRGLSHFKWFNSSQLAMQLLIIVPLVLLPMLTVNNVFSSWLLITTLLVAFLFAKEIRDYCGKWKEESGKRIALRQKVISSLFPLSSFLSIPDLRTIVKYSSGRLVADFFQFSLAAFPLIYISNVQGLQPTAYFSVGITYVTMITPLFSFMGIILLPYVSKAIARHEMSAANRLIHRLLLLYVVASLFFIHLHRIPHHPALRQRLCGDHRPHTHHDPCHPAAGRLHALSQHHRCRQRHTLQRHHPQRLPAGDDRQFPPLHHPHPVRLGLSRRLHPPGPPLHHHLASGQEAIITLVAVHL